MISKLEQARQILTQEQQEAAKKDEEAKKREAEKAESDQILDGIHRDGLAIIENHYDPGTKVVKFLSLFLDPSVTTTIEEEGHPPVTISIEKPKDHRDGQQVDIFMSGLKERLSVSKSIKGVITWELFSHKKGRHVTKDHNPLSEAREWRAVMDIMVERFPVPQASSPVTPL